MVPAARVGWTMAHHVIVASTVEPAQRRAVLSGDIWKSCQTCATCVRARICILLSRYGSIKRLRASRIIVFCSVLPVHLTVSHETVNIN